MQSPDRGRKSLRWPPAGRTRDRVFQCDKGIHISLLLLGIMVIHAYYVQYSTYSTVKRSLSYRRVVDWELLRFNCKLLDLSCCVRIGSIFPSRLHIRCRPD